MSAGSFRGIGRSIHKEILFCKDMQERFLRYKLYENQIDKKAKGLQSDRNNIGEREQML